LPNSYNIPVFVWTDRLPEDPSTISCKKGCRTANCGCIRRASIEDFTNIQIKTSSNNDDIDDSCNSNESSNEEQCMEKEIMTDDFLNTSIDIV